MKNKTSNILRYGIVYLVLLFLLCLVVHLNINIGSVKISFFNILKIIFLQDGKGSSEYTIIMNIRLPRMLLAGLLGGALALSGYLLQTFFRNPIAGPYVLGISSSAKMFVSFTMLFLIPLFKNNVPMYLQILAAFIGSMIATIFVLLFSKKVKSMSMLLVIGVMIGYICSALTDFFITFASENDIANLVHWGLGNFNNANWNKVLIASIIVLPLAILTFCLSKPIGAYLLGEGYAFSMGVNVKTFRKVIIIISSLLSACVTALVGPISFVGIAVPQIAKKSLATAKPIVTIPAVFLTGFVFTMFCDLISRVVFSPTQLAIGSVTSIFGAPIVIYLMLQKHKREA